MESRNMPKSQDLSGSGRTPPISADSLAAQIADAFRADILSLERCRELLQRLLHPDGPACPRCHAPLDASLLQRWRQGRQVKCGCGRHYTWRSGAIVQNAKLSPCQVVLLAVFLALLPRASNAELARRTGVSRESIRAWRSRLEVGRG